MSLSITCDGNGLYLRVRATGGRSWILRRKRGGHIEVITWYTDVVRKTYRRPREVRGYIACQTSSWGARKPRAIGC